MTQDSKDIGISIEILQVMRQEIKLAIGLEIEGAIEELRKKIQELRKEIQELKSKKLHQGGIRID
jgi:prefoldin subunit 5